jgi:hypothetical protein
MAWHAGIQVSWDKYRRRRTAHRRGTPVHCLLLRARWYIEAHVASKMGVGSGATGKVSAHDDPMDRLRHSGPNTTLRRAAALACLLLFRYFKISSRQQVCLGRNHSAWTFFSLIKDPCLLTLRRASAGASRVAWM